MGRIITILFSIIFFNFLIFSLSFPFKIISHNLEYALYKKNKLIWSFKIKKFIQKENGNFEGKTIYIINKEKDWKYGRIKVFIIKKKINFYFRVMFIL